MGRTIDLQIELQAIKDEPDVLVTVILPSTIQSNFKISESLTVYVSSGGMKFIAQELSSHRTIAGAV
jgi:hypothetical protein